MVPMKLYDDRVGGDPFNVSASLYTTYLQCPQQALGRLQGFYGKGSIASFKGKLAHKIFAAHLEDGEIPADVFSMTCKKAVGADLSQDMAELGMSISQFNGVVSEVEALYERFKTLPMDGFKEAEVEFDLDAGGGVALRGRMDAIFADEDGTRIIDWKTGTYVSDNEPQLDFYAMVWKLLHDELPIATDALSVATGENLHRVPNDATVLRTVEDVGAMIDALRTALSAGSELARTAGPYCRWCPILDTCQEGTAAVDLL